MLLSACSSETQLSPAPTPLDSGVGPQVEVGDPQQRGGLVAYQRVSTIPAALTNFIYLSLSEAAAIDVEAALGVARPSYTVENYRLSYRTEAPDGSLITATGLLSLPLKRGKMPVLSYQHATAFLETQVPSNSHSQADQAVLIASVGFAVSAPDYLGYGDSADLPHPYLHSKTLASSSIDMLRAAYEFMALNSLEDNGQLFLMGYSEGGKATLAMQREIETQLSDEFSITASAPGSGSYDMRATVSTALANPPVGAEAYLAWLFKAYDRLSGLGRLAEIIMPEYLSVVENGFDGTQSNGVITAKLTTGGGLISPQFAASYLSGGEPEFMAFVAENDDYDWAPAVPTALFHGRDDKLVPFFNSQNSFDRMLINGSTSVELMECVMTDATQLADHESCVIPYLDHVIRYFSGYVQDL